MFFLKKIELTFNPELFFELAHIHGDKSSNGGTYFSRIWKNKKKRKSSFTHDILELFSTFEHFFLVVLYSIFFLFFGNFNLLYCLI